MSFVWNRGRQLSKVKLDNEKTIEYSYNEVGLRTYKDTEEATTVYEWDDNALIREIIKYKKQIRR